MLLYRHNVRVCVCVFVYNGYIYIYEWNEWMDRRKEAREKTMYCVLHGPLGLGASRPQDQEPDRGGFKHQKQTYTWTVEEISPLDDWVVFVVFPHFYVFLLMSALLSLSFSLLLIPADQTVDDQTASRSLHSPDCLECSHTAVGFKLFCLFYQFL